MQKVLVSGCYGFLGGYITQDLLNKGYQVIGIDNFSKYGKIYKELENSEKFEFVEGDVKNLDLMKNIIQGSDHFIAGAAMIGGISYFHEFAYDLIAENERILASSFDAAIHEYKYGNLKKITVISSSMVFENSKTFPSFEGDELKSPPPLSTYGFQKLSSEYFCKGAAEQYQLPYTIIRPFNCIGTGEITSSKESKISSGNIKLALSHVLPDLILKCLKNQNPLHILGDGEQTRCFTYGGDIAHGIELSLNNKKALNEDFNISISKETKILDLAKIIWKKIYKNEDYNFVFDEPFMHDVRKRIPDISKAKKLLNFEAKTPLDDVIDEIIFWIENNYN